MRMMSSLRRQREGVTIRSRVGVVRNYLIKNAIDHGHLKSLLV